MKLINITPIMTSNTAPSPYKIYRGSTDGSNLESAWKAFDNRTDTSWDWYAGKTTNWIELWFDADTIVDYIKVLSGVNNSNYITTISIQGTNDRINYTLLQEITGMTKTTFPELIEIPRQKRNKYKCYRLNFTAKISSGYTKYPVQSIYFYKDEDRKDVSEKIKASVKEAILTHELIKDNITLASVDK